MKKVTIARSEQVQYTPSNTYRIITAGNPLTFTVSATDAGIQGVTVSTNTSFSTTTDASGFHSLTVTPGALEITAALDPVYYTNSSIPVTAVSGAVVVQDIELDEKPTGTITGSVTNA